MVSALSYPFHAMSPASSLTLPCLSPAYKSLYSKTEDLVDLHEEKNRQETFLFWPKWAPSSLTTKSLVKSGFSYTGDRDQVKCYSCKVVVEGWREGDDPLEKHRNLSPKCAVVQRLRRTDDDLTVDGVPEDEDCVDGAVSEAISVQKNSKLFSQNTKECLQIQAKTKSRKFDKKNLKEENDKLRLSMMCRKCNKERVQTLFLPCRHLVTCETCAELMDDCIQCKQRILGTVRTYMV